MTLSTNTRPRLRRLLVPVIVAAMIVVPVAAADNGPEVKGENYYARGLLAQASETVANGPEVKGENYYARGLLARTRETVDNGPVVKGENYYARGLPAQTLEPVASIPTSTAFQWSDAAVGAGSSLVIVGLAMGGYLVLRRRHLHPKLS
jgi:hypothetical protein